MKRLLFCLSLVIFVTSFSLNACDYKILGIGAPAMDMLISVDEEFLKTIPGEKGGSLEVNWEDFSKIMQYGQSQNIFVASGGSASNTIKGLASLGQKSAFFGKTGRDEMSYEYLSRITSFGVIPLLIETETPITQVAGLITPDGQRTFRYFLGASKELKGEDLTESLFQDVTLVHIEVYALYNGDLVEKAMQLAKEAGALVSIDLGSFEVVKQFKERLLHLISSYVDIVFSNEDEIKALTGLDSEAGGEFLKDLCPIAVVKLGKDGCFVMSGSYKIHSPGIPAKVVKDTTGAGDHFASGFLHGFLEGCSLDVCGYYGNLTGSAAVEVYGAEIPESKWEELRKLMPLKEVETILN